MQNAKEEKNITVHVVAGCVIERDSKFLLVQEKQAKVYGLWNLPAGKVETGQTIKAAAIREVKEETGFNVKLISEIGIYHKDGDSAVKHVFEARIVSGELLIPEILDAKWLSFEEILNFNQLHQLRGTWVIQAIEKYLKDKIEKPFIPADFIVQKELKTENFTLKMLTEKFAEPDYQAVMSSIDHLKGVFGPNSTWPQADLTFEENKQSLCWHKEEFKNKASFSYAVLNQDESEYLGCVYIFPAYNPSHDADVFLWVRESAYNNGQDPILFSAIRKWLKEKWPFKKVNFPGRING